MFMSLLLDTSILIDGLAHPLDRTGISAVSIAELHFGVLVARNEDERADRIQRLATIEGIFNPLPFDAAAARECGRLQARVVQRGGQPRRRSFDLAIAATAKAHGVPLLTRNPADFKLIEDLVEIRSPD
jgi:predicted nucleic acid-binding protein